MSGKTDGRVRRSNSVQAAGEPSPKDLKLATFFPYRLAVLSFDVSQTISQLYADRFNLTRQEWRVLAALGENKHMSAAAIAEYSTLEKMQVSRAVSKLLKAGLIAREENIRDRRSHSLRLSDKGVAIYRKIVPLVLAREKFILSALSERERKEMDSIFAKLVNKTREMRKMG